MALEEWDLWEIKEFITSDTDHGGDTAQGGPGDRGVDTSSRPIKMEEDNKMLVREEVN